MQTAEKEVSHGTVVKTLNTPSPFPPKFNTFLSCDEELEKMKKPGLLVTKSVLITWGLEGPTQLETLTKSTLRRNSSRFSPNANYNVKAL